MILGLPFLRTDYFKSMIQTDVDGVASASVILDAPSGKYYICMNRSIHEGSPNEEAWKTYFETGEITYIFEDISCSVSSVDAGGMEMARSIQSVLPENQMKLYTENHALLLSRMDHGLYDVIIFSQEYAEEFCDMEKLEKDALVYVREDEAADSGSETEE